MEFYVSLSSQKPQDAIAVFGGAKSDLDEILTSGIVPPVPESQMTSPPYRQRMSRSGMNLYYCLPIITSLESHDRFLASEFYNQYRDDRKHCQTALSYERATKTAEHYALSASIRRPFQELMGGQLAGIVDTDTILELASEILHV